MFENSNSIYRRKIVVAERVLIPVPFALAGVVMQVKGEIDKDLFIKAVYKIYDMYPVLNSKVVLDENKEAWFEELKDETSPIIIERRSDETFKDLVNNQWKTPFYLDKGPLSRFFLVHSKFKSEIVFIAHHVLVDGFGANKIIELILQFVKNPDKEYKLAKEEPLPSKENLIKIKSKFAPDGFFKRAGEKILFNYVKRRWEKTKLSLTEEDKEKSYESLFQSFDYAWKHDTLTEKQTYEFFKICREKNVTTNSAMTIAFLACRKEIDKEHENNRQRISVDLRKHLGRNALDSISCYASSVDLNYVYNETISFWENVINFHKMTKTYFDEYVELDSMIQLSKFPLDFLEAMTLSQRMQRVPKDYEDLDNFKRLGPKSNHIAAVFARNSLKVFPSITITNMGVGRFLNSYDNLKIEKCILLPSAPTQAAFSVILSSITINKCLGFTLNSAKPKDGSIKEFDRKFNLLSKRFKEFLINDIFK